MTDREWPEYPNQSGGETVTGPESAQEEAASERGWEADPPSPASEECQSEEGSNWERTAQEAQEEVPGGQRGEDLGTPGQAQELQEPRLSSGRRLRAFPNHRNIGLEARNGILRG